VRTVPTSIAQRLIPAAELFADRGLDQTKIEDVAEATGVPKATLYYYFSGKEDLLAFLLRDTLAAMADAVADAISTDQPARDRLVAVVQAQLRLIRDNPDTCRVLLAELGRIARLQDIAEQVHGAFHRPVEELLRAGATDKSIRRVDVEPVTAAIYGSVMITGLHYIIAGRTGEQGRYGLPGDPRAFDLLTGKEVWRFHVVPQPGDENFGTWGLNGWQDRRGPGVWVPMTVDPVNDLVLIPLGNATDQNYGGSRPGLNLYATTLLALRASTGTRVWHQQLTHHDIYDWDVNCPPAMVEAVDKDGHRVPAVAQMTKQGMLFVFNRLTGEPIFGMEERPVPRFDAPGDEAWPTQPFPVKPAGLTRDGMTRKEVSKISPEAEKYCTELFDKSVNMGPYTPYGMLPSLVFPGSEGGGGWGGVAANPDLGLVFVNPRHLGVIAQLQSSTSSGVLPSFGKQKVPTNFYVDQQGYPCNAPPWSEIVAVSSTTGVVVWRTPLGEYPELTKKGILNTGTAVNDGGPIATASGLVFIGATTDFGFRAFDARTGQELWRATLPDDALMTPLTYQGGNGKQFVAVVAGGGDAIFHIPAKPSPGANATVVAFSLK